MEEQVVRAAAAEQVYAAVFLVMELYRVHREQQAPAVKTDKEGPMGLPAGVLSGIWISRY